jgi:hypothetical protein
VRICHSFYQADDKRRTHIYLFLCNPTHAYYRSKHSLLYGILLKQKKLVRRDATLGGDRVRLCFPRMLLLLLPIYWHRAMCGLYIHALGLMLLRARSFICVEMSIEMDYTTNLKEEAAPI